MQSEKADLDKYEAQKEHFSSTLSNFYGPIAIKNGSAIQENNGNE